MIKISYIHYEKRLESSLFYKLLDLLPNKLSQRVLRYNRWEDAYAALLGKLLLQNQIEQIDANFQLANLKYTEYGRPYYDSDLDFNISHSGHYVVLAVSEKSKVGIDIEEIKPLELNDFRSQFAEDEWLDIIGSKDVYSRFYHYWTAKEAVTKAQGKGLNTDLRKVIIKNNVTKLDDLYWYYRRINISSNCISHIASSSRMLEMLEIKELSVSDLNRL